MILPGCIALKPTSHPCVIRFFPSSAIAACVFASTDDRVERERRPQAAMSSSVCSRRVPASFGVAHRLDQHDRVVGVERLAVPRAAPARRDRLLEEELSAAALARPLDLHTAPSGPVPPPERAPGRARRAAPTGGRRPRRGRPASRTTRRRPTTTRARRRVCARAARRRPRCRAPGRHGAIGRGRTPPSATPARRRRRCRGGRAAPHASASSPLAAARNRRSAPSRRSMLRIVRAISSRVRGSGDMSSASTRARLPCSLRVFALQRSLGYGGGRTTSIKEEQGGKRREGRGRGVHRNLRADLLRGGRDHHDGWPGPRRDRARARARDRDHGLDHGPHLGRGVQPGDPDRAVGDGQDADRPFRGLHRRRAARRRRRRVLPEVHRADARLRRRQGRHPRRRGRVRGRQGGRARGDADVLPRLGGVRHRGRRPGAVREDGRVHDRARDHDRHLRRRRADRARR